MLKITTMILLVLIGTLWAARISCKSCGQECASACGTRYFRSCCFNYLRRKRGSDDVQVIREPKSGIQEDLPFVYAEDYPEDWLQVISGGKDTLENSHHIRDIVSSSNI